jgi:hypothetical protein
MGSYEKAQYQPSLLAASILRVRSLRSLRECLNGDFCTAAGGFEFALGHHSVGSAGIATTMNSTEELFLLRPHPRRVTTRAVDDRSPRPRQARSAIQHRFPRVPGSPRTQSLPTSLGLLSSSSAHHMIGPTSAPVHPLESAICREHLCQSCRLHIVK